MKVRAESSVPVCKRQGPPTLKNELAGRPNVQNYRIKTNYAQRPLSL